MTDRTATGVSSPIEQMPLYLPPPLGEVLIPNPQLNLQVLTFSNSSLMKFGFSSKMKFFSRSIICLLYFL